MNTPFFSIIIPVYNAAADIENALKSVCDQHFRDFEIIVMDGVSTDDTAAIVRKKATADNRIKLVVEKDAGIYDAMNKGIALAAGKWVYFLGSDDVLHNDEVLRTVHDLLQEDKADVWYGDVLIMPGRERYGGLFSAKQLLYRNISHQAIFYKRTIFEQVGLYNLAFKMHADWDFNIRCFESEAVTRQYREMIVAEFMEGRTSAGHDRQFLRMVLIPKKMEDIRLNPKQLRKIPEYDYCWRLFRNASLGSSTEGDIDLPNKILKAMVRFQEKIPAHLLKNGYLSKSFMLISYLQSLFIKAR